MKFKACLLVVALFAAPISAQDVTIGGLTVEDALVILNALAPPAPPAPPVDLEEPTTAGLHIDPYFPFYWADWNIVGETSGYLAEPVDLTGYDGDVVRVEVVLNVGTSLLTFKRQGNLLYLASAKKGGKVDDWDNVPLDVFVRGSGKLVIKARSGGAWVAQDSGKDEITRAIPLQPRDQLHLAALFDVNGRFELHIAIERGEDNAVIFREHYAGNSGPFPGGQVVLQVGNPSGSAKDVPWPAGWFFQHVAIGKVDGFPGSSVDGAREMSDAFLAFAKSTKRSGPSGQASCECRLFGRFATGWSPLAPTIYQPKPSAWCSRYWTAVHSCGVTCSRMGMFPPWPWGLDDVALACQRDPARIIYEKAKDAKLSAVRARALLEEAGGAGGHVAAALSALDLLDVELAYLMD